MVEVMAIHVTLNYLYKLSLYVEKSLRELKLPARLIAIILKSSQYLEETYNRIYSKLMDGVTLIPAYVEAMHSRVHVKLMDEITLVPVYTETITEKLEGALTGTEGVVELRTVGKKGLLQHIVESSSRAELLTYRRVFRLTELLQLLQRSLSSSLLTTSLLVGTLFTIAMLFLVVRSL